ncbi:hypothetical protein KDA_37240 [Dictyobacter alpinus]|uniref:Uncharacterized protein n=1 Tax=Dictyobacter alpinus TaxID=2014873 RepID=A0A402BAA3_9CHLR|nr:hypothetical protein KDA_37240 [Dictyobacter alpinus]
MIPAYNISKPRHTAPLAVGQLQGERYAWWYIVLRILNHQGGRIFALASCGKTSPLNRLAQQS